MGNGSPPSSQSKHDRGWQYLRTLDFDVGLLQETRAPRPGIDGDWASVVWRPKYERPDSRRPLWGCAVLTPQLELEPYEPAESSPWLARLRGSTAIARSPVGPSWLVSVHAHSRQLSPAALAEIPSSDIPIAPPNGSMWETDVIPYELARLFAGESFVWG